MRVARQAGVSADVAYVQLTLHLVSGGQRRFVQTEPGAAGGLLEHLRPERIFVQKQILIAGADAVTVISTNDVERIDLRSDPLPDWPHREVVSPLREVSAEDFARIQRREPPTVPTAVSARITTPPREIGVAAELRSGAPVYFTARPRPPQGMPSDTPLTPDDIRAFLQHLFARPVLFGRMEEEQGIFLINPSNAVLFVVAPPPPVQSLASVWPMETEPLPLP